MSDEARKLLADAAVFCAVALLLVCTVVGSIRLVQVVL